MVLMETVYCSNTHYHPYELNHNGNSNLISEGSIRKDTEYMQGQLTSGLEGYVDTKKVPFHVYTMHKNILSQTRIWFTWG